MIRITPEIETLIDAALTEDLSLGDATTEALISPELTAKAVVIAKEEGVLAGIGVSMAVFRRVDPELNTRALKDDSSILDAGDVVASIEGCVASILEAERTALNFLQRLSGIATATRDYVLAIDGYDAQIIDTRKTTPGLRALEKYAIRAGGGHNHRRNLGDGILIKDNHIQALRNDGLTLGDIIKKAHANAPHTIKVEVEVETLDEVQEALDAGAEIILLDNMNVEQMTLAVGMCKGKAITEASGGINIDTVRAVASSGVNLISVGALTHSVKALNLSLDM